MEAANVLKEEYHDRNENYAWFWQSCYPIFIGTNLDIPLHSIHFKHIWDETIGIFKSLHLNPITLSDAGN